MDSYVFFLNLREELTTLEREKAEVEEPTGPVTRNSHQEQQERKDQWNDEHSYRLEELQSWCEEVGAEVWNGHKDVIMEDDIYEYAEVKAREENPGVDFGEWPFDTIDWDFASEQFRERYECVCVDGYDIYIEA